MEHDHQHLLLLIRPLLSFKTLFNIANDLHGHLHGHLHDTTLQPIVKKIKVCFEKGRLLEMGNS